MAHATCNRDKRALLPAPRHLQVWVDRNREHQSDISDLASNAGFMAELARTFKIAQWAYRQTELQHGAVWEQQKQITALSPDWQALLAGAMDD